jgi:hypothetical protein
MNRWRSSDPLALLAAVWEKRAISANLVTRTLSRALERPGAVENPAFMRRVGDFADTVRKWLPGAGERATEAARDSLGRGPRHFRADTPPEGLTNAFMNTTMPNLPPPRMPWIEANTGLNPGYDARVHRIVGPAVELSRPHVLFHELGHARNPVPPKPMTPREFLGEEVGAWRRGSQMWNTYQANSAVPANFSYQQFLQKRHAPLETYRLLALEKALNPGRTLEASAFPGAQRRLVGALQRMPKLPMNGTPP